MTDIVSYKPPFGIIGNLANPMIKGKLIEIFDYRSKVLSDIFN
jgi:ligand-binding SRPBCC domain-containing protein